MQQFGSMRAELSAHRKKRREPYGKRRGAKRTSGARGTVFWQYARGGHLPDYSNPGSL